MTWTDGTPIAAANSIDDYVFIDTARPNGDGFTTWPRHAPRSVATQIDYRAITSGVKLVVTFVIEDNHCTTGDVGELWLMAATLR
jgi:hypothetical protein